MLILGIETSCDETAASVLEGGQKIRSNIVLSQSIHRDYGGVVPELASRAHIKTLIPIIRKALEEANVSLGELEAVAVTFGPGLVGSLLVGLSMAKSLAFSLNIPFIGVNHIEGHIFANFLEHPHLKPPLIHLVVSGGHTQLLQQPSLGQYRLLGQTLDDAAGEAFDKAARILGLGYPGGPAIEKAARGGSDVLKLPRAWLTGTYDFSFSGVKTALLRRVEAAGVSSPADAACSFQAAVVEVLVTKTVAVAREYRVKHVLLAGGVAANGRLREKLASDSPVPVLVPETVLCTDNAAMIAASGYYRLRAGKKDGLDLDVVPNLKLA